MKDEVELQDSRRFKEMMEQIMEQIRLIIPFW